MCSSDWSSDVCSSDLAGVLGRALFVAAGAALRPGDGAVLDAPGLPDLLRRAAAAGGTGRQATGAGHDRHRAARPARRLAEIGRASWRERVRPNLSISVYTIA